MTDKEILEESTRFENRGREAYKNYEKQLNGGIYQYEFTEGRWINWDVIYPSIDRADEIKYRDISAGKYLKNGYMLEKTKYDALREHKSGYYVCFFHDCMMMWDIKNMAEPYFEEIECTDSTIQYGERKRMKTVALLEYDNAFMICYKHRILNRDERQRFKRYIADEWEAEEKKNEDAMYALIREVMGKK